jgi:glycine betaine/proline transport system permease protein
MRFFLAQATEETKGIFDNLLLDEWRIPFGDWMDQSVDWIDNNLQTLLDVIEWPFQTLIDTLVNNFLAEISWLWIVLGMALIASLVRNVKVGVFVGLALTACGLLGNAYWLETARTIGFIGVAVLLCVIIGIPIGVAAGRIDGVWQVTRPILDAMQVVHSFVYMLPFIFFWGIGPVSATMVTMIFALPPLIRLTNLGIRQVPDDVVEASRAYGAPEWRVLLDVQLPLARPAIMTGINQTLLLAISMLGIAAIMGAGGLGRLLFQALSNQDVALATSGGLAFFLVAVVLDRMSQRESDDVGGNLFHRIRQAWAHRRNPEELLPDDAEASTGIKFETSEQFAPIKAAERMPIALAGIGALVALLSVFLPWTSDAGKFSAFGRSADINLEGSTFSGLAASGGSWFGFVVLGLALFVVLAVVVGYARPGKGSRWLTADGALIGSVAMLATAGAHLLGNRYTASAEALDPGTGIGVILAILGALAATAGSLLWLRRADHSPLHPLSPDVAWGRMTAIGVTALVMLAGTFSGWSFDARAETVISPEIEAKVQELRDRAAAEPENAGPIAAEIQSTLAQARSEGSVPINGIDGDGPGLGLWALLLGLGGVAGSLYAVGLFGVEDDKLWFSNAVVAGLGAGVASISFAWIFTQVRSADPNYVSGIGSFLMLSAGFFLLASTMTVLKEFRRTRIYDDEGGEIVSDQLTPGRVVEATVDA